MIKIVICDDDNFYLNKIRELIQEDLYRKRINDFEIKTFASGDDLCEIEDIIYKFQVFFLDINMAGINGLAAAKRIRKQNRNALLIFITSYIDYAMEGYRVEAIRFIIKDMLEEMMPECIDTIIQKLKIEKSVVEYNFTGGKKELYSESIVYIESDKHKVAFYVKCNAKNLETFYLYDKLDSIQHELEKYGFLRIHKSYLVNMKYIKDIIRYKAVLKIGIELPIPRDKYNLIMEKYCEYEGKMM